MLQYLIKHFRQLNDLKCICRKADFFYFQWCMFTIRESFPSKNPLETEQTCCKRSLAICQYINQQEAPAIYTHPVRCEMFNPSTVRDDTLRSLFNVIFSKTSLLRNKLCFLTTNKTLMIDDKM